MYPCFTHFELAGQKGGEFSVCMSLANNADVRGGKFFCSFLRSDQTKLDSMLRILFSGYVFKVLDAIILLVAVFMVNTKSIRAVSEKRRRDQSVYQFVGAEAGTREIYHEIPFSALLAYASYFVLVICAHPTNAPKRTCFVESDPCRYWFPDFSGIFNGHGHNLLSRFELWRGWQGSSTLSCQPLYCSIERSAVNAEAD